MSMPDHFVSSNDDSWATPQALFDAIDHTYGPFILDAAAADDSAKCRYYFTVEDDALSRDWSGRVFLNPPYNRSIHKWSEKVTEELEAGRIYSCTLLIAARTDTRWWNHLVESRYCVEVLFLKGRVKFGDGTASAPFASAVIHLAGCYDRHRWPAGIRTYYGMPHDLDFGN